MDEKELKNTSPRKKLDIKKKLALAFLVISLIIGSVTWKYLDIKRTEQIEQELKQREQTIKDTYILLEKLYPNKTFEVEYISTIYATCLEDGIRFHAWPYDNDTMILTYQYEYWKREIMAEVKNIYGKKISYHTREIVLNPYSLRIKVDGTNEDLMEFHKQMGFKTYEEVIEYLQDYPEIETEVKIRFALSYSSTGTYEQEVKKVKELLKKFVLPLPCVMDEEGDKTRGFNVGIYYIEKGINIKGDYSEITDNHSRFYQNVTEGTYMYRDDNVYINEDGEDFVDFKIITFENIDDMDIGYKISYIKKEGDELEGQIYSIGSLGYNKLHGLGSFKNDE